jgi:hypothetical protein
VAGKYYVYILRDPRDGKPFYVGKGRHRRMGQHVLDTGETAKTAKIKEITDAGRGIEYVVESEWEREEDAFWRETELIQSTPGLTNVIHNRCDKPRVYLLHDLMFDALANLHTSPRRAVYQLERAIGMFYDRLADDDWRKTLLRNMARNNSLKPYIKERIENGKNQRLAEQTN